MVDLTELLHSAKALAYQSGLRILEIYQDLHPQVDCKPDRSPVTQADLISHEILEQGLAGLFPGLPVLSEESPEVPFEDRRGWRNFWLIDPLDGTREFLNRSGEFTVNIALIEQNLPVLGVVYAPVIDTLYFAARDLGAYRVNGAVSTPIRVAPAECTRLVVSRHHACETDFLNGGECRVMGSSLKFCLIAEGAADLYPRNGPTMEWDTAAAQCILEEAGGSVTDLQGIRVGYNKPCLRNSGFVARAVPCAEPTEQGVLGDLYDASTRAH